MQQLQRETILVVEDEKSLRAAIKHRLESDGFDVVATRESDQAVGLLLQERKVDAIWLDHYLFGHDSGFDLMNQLQKNELWKSIPVFVVSNTVSPDKAKDYLALGAKKFYIKVDYRLDAIVKDIRTVLQGGVI